MKTLCSVLLLATVVIIPASAQGQTIKPKAHVRVWLSSGKQVDGTVQFEDSQSLIVAITGSAGAEKPLVAPWTSITRVDVDHHRPALFTALAFAASGFLLSNTWLVYLPSALLHFGATRTQWGLLSGGLGLIVGQQHHWERIDVSGATSTLTIPSLSVKFRF
jgi:hypothetical protein